MDRARFTLIELLVVIAIISILASMLMPVFSRARAKGRQTACLSNVKQLLLACQMYSQDYDEFYPRGEQNGEQWHEIIYPYTHNKQILRCADRKDRYVGYGYNWLASGVTVGQFFDASNKIIMCDVPPEALGITVNAPGDEWWANDPGNDICNASGGTVAVGGEDPNDNSFRAINRPQRHNDGLNFGYADGHAKWAKEEQVDSAKFWSPQTPTD
jgi:prepilin-type N-terminal cleavage/methylation domain-containing protein/prepilin-type processing-associated H-X9-DG protein